MQECSISGCDSKATRRGWCNKHYERWRVHGNPEKSLYNIPIEDRFLNHLNYDGDCILWVGSRIKQGYGVLWTGEKHIMAHRYAWEREHGEIPEGMLVDHKDHCSKACVNTKHLRLATKRQNNHNRSGPNKNNTTGHRNVVVNKGRLEVRISGTYYATFNLEDIEEAVKFEEMKRKELFGEYAGRG